MAENDVLDNLKSNKFDEQNLALLKQYAQDKVKIDNGEMSLGDSKAREQLVELNLAMVHDTLRRRSFHSQLNDYDDLFIIGSIGLTHAVDSYDLENASAKFSSYAMTVIEREIARELTYENRKKNSINYMKSSLDETLKGGRKTKDDSDGKELGDFVPDVSVDIEGDTIDNDEKLRLLHALKYLTPQEQKIIYEQFYGEQSVAQIAEYFNYSRESVNSKSIRAKNKIRVLLSGESELSKKDIAQKQKLLSQGKIRIIPELAQVYTANFGDDYIKNYTIDENWKTEQPLQNGEQAPMRGNYDIKFKTLLS